LICVCDGLAALRFPSAPEHKLKLDFYISYWLYSHMAIHNQNAQLDRVFSALADPTRRAMLSRLAIGEATVSQLMEPFKLSQPAISKHLKVLEDAGFIERGRDAQRRPRKLVARALKEVVDWIEPFHRQWESRFNNLDDYLATMKKVEK
jgi:DNA-binding transcriptional ArsR family regulator